MITLQIAAFKAIGIIKSNKSGGKTLLFSTKKSYGKVKPLSFAPLQIAYALIKNLGVHKLHDSEIKHGSK